MNYQAGIVTIDKILDQNPKIIQSVGLKRKREIEPECEYLSSNDHLENDVSIHLGRK